MNRSRAAGMGQGFNFGVGMIAAIVVVILLAIGCICAFCVVTVSAVAIVSSDETRPTARTDRNSSRFEPAGSAGERNQPGGGGSAPVAGIGQDVLAGDVRWTVLDAQDMGNTLQSNNDLIDPMTTGGRFVRVRFEIENRSSEARTFTGVSLVDAQGRTFEDSTETLIGFVDNEERCIFEQLNPNVPRICTTIFEVPADAAGLQVKVTNLALFGAEEAFIDLALSAAPSAPQEPGAEEAAPAEPPPAEPPPAEGEPMPPAGEEGVVPPEGAEQTVSQGVDTFVGQTRWKVLEAVDIGNRLHNGDENLVPLETEGRLIRVRFEVENTGQEVSSFQDITLTDQQGRTFEPSLDAIWFIEESEQCLSEELEPGVPLVCTKVYDVPADATGLTLQAVDLFDPEASGTAPLDLGLN